MSLPNKLKNLNLFHNAVSLAGEVAECTLPKLGRNLELWRGGGMNGPIAIDQGMSDDSIDFEWKVGGLNLDSIRQYGITSASGVLLRFAGAYQQDDTGAVTPVEVVIRGRHEEIDMGTQKPGDDTEQTIKTKWTYYKLTVNGKIEAEIDVLGMKEIIGGVDRLEAQRKACGL
ncbi:MULTISPECIES: phage major tail tube protein [Acinetobacter]|uniref:phage major tail tube protein n=1 Tax=Acinetobacter TaxID=469 RepID=UPI00124C243D|nr:MULTISPECIES: phage major tail tube protein [Acinetobacter]MBJ9370568.1 phage major tail tube protein [Acinetobacter sp. TGL-Y2]MDA3440026.1 phage major tail tube protein [Acinetobacter bereziniae]